MFKGLLFSWGFGIGHIKLPLPNLFKRIVLEEISSDLSLEVAKAGFIGKATVSLTNSRITIFTRVVHFCFYSTLSERELS